MQAAMWFQALDQHFHWYSRRAKQDAIKWRPIVIDNTHELDGL